MMTNELNDLLRHIVREQFGFLKDHQLTKLAKLDRLHPVLIRCGCGRFTCPAQDARHFAGIIDREGSDYIRDIGLVADDAAVKAYGTGRFVDDVMVTGD